VLLLIVATAGLAAFVAAKETNVDDDASITVDASTTTTTTTTMASSARTGSKAMWKVMALPNGPWPTPDPFLFCAYHDDKCAYLLHSRVFLSSLAVLPCVAPTQDNRSLISFVVQPADPAGDDKMRAPRSGNGADFDWRSGGFNHACRFCQSLLAFVCACAFAVKHSQLYVPSLLRLQTTGCTTESAFRDSPDTRTAALKVGSEY
jgi:hypothetical protein